jgi:hypothetical protein
MRSTPESVPHRYSINPAMAPVRRSIGILIVKEFFGILYAVAILFFE